MLKMNEFQQINELNSYSIIIILTFKNTKKRTLLQMILLICNNKNNFGDKLQRLHSAFFLCILSLFFIIKINISP